MIINRVTELKIRKTKLDTIITGTNPKLGPLSDQYAIVEKWKTSAGRIFVHTTQNTGLKFDGLRVSIGKEPDLASVLKSYVINIPGREIFLICAPNVIINPEQTAFFNYAENEKMERSWAAYATDAPEGLPKAFVMTAPVLPYVLQNIPPNLSFGTQEWAIWLHQWMSKFMLSHRYFNADAFGLIHPAIVKPIDPVIVADLLDAVQDQPKAPEPVLEPVLSQKVEPVEAQIAQPVQEPVKAKKKGRPKKIQLQTA